MIKESFQDPIKATPLTRRPTSAGVIDASNQLVCIYHCPTFGHGWHQPHRPRDFDGTKEIALSRYATANDNDRRRFFQP